MTITVIIPAYNRERYITEALDSVRLQTRQPDEVIVVDDGSTDRTVDVANDWSREHSYPIHIIQQKNQGGAAARNAAINAATSELIAPLDSDDVFLPQHLKTLSKGFAIRPDVVISVANSARLDSLPGGKKSSFTDDFFRKWPCEQINDEVFILSSVTAFRTLLRGAWFAMCSAMFKRSAALEIKSFDHTLPSYHDQDFWLRLSRLGTLALQKTPVSLVRKHTENLTGTQKRVQRILCGLRVRLKALESASGDNCTSDESRAVRSEIERYARTSVVNASRHGFGTYFQIQRELMKHGLAIHGLQFKSLARALVFPRGRAKV